MAADPVAAATALAGQTYAGAQERTAATQKALLDSLAANGTYQNSLNTAATAAAAPTPAGPSLGGGVPSANAPMSGQMANIAGAGSEQINTMGHAALAAATALAAHQATQEAQANSNYFSQAAAAMPLEQSRSASMAQQILADLQAKREAAAAAKAHDAMQLQIEQAQLQAARTAAAAKANPTLSYTDRANMTKSALNAALPESLAVKTVYTTAPNGTVTSAQVHTPLAQALLQASTNPGADIAQTAKQFGLSPQDEQTLVDSLNRYESALATQGYYADPSQIPSWQMPAAEKPAGNMFQGITDKVNSVIPKGQKPPTSKLTKAPEAIPAYGPTGAIQGYVTGGVPQGNFTGTTGTGVKVVNGKIVK